MDEYTPVDCDFHDRFEALATLRKDCTIVYRNAGEIAEIRGKIIDVYAKNKADWCKMNNGTEIRLDWIVSLN
jgi:Rho-binding antiterminator